MASKPRIFVYIHYLEIGGAERSLIGLLNALDPEKVDIDLFLCRHSGEFMKLVPDYVNLLPELPEYATIEKPFKQILKEGHFGMALRRFFARRRHRRFLIKNAGWEFKADESVFQYMMRGAEGGLRDLSFLGTYDLAISFLHPHNIVLNKVKARKKICWIHTDYSTVRIDTELEAKMWLGFDNIISISPAAGDSFVQKFPEARDKIIEIENILSPASIRAQADNGNHDDMPRRQNETILLSIGRFCEAKRFDLVPQMCRVLLDMGLRFRWYIIGIGDDSLTRQRIAEYGVEDRVVLLGPKENPYPYIKACDIYVQPSLFEGKCVTVREAQILCKPVLISNYTTATSQVQNGVDGYIAPMPPADFARELFAFTNNKPLQQNIVQYLQANDYGNATEVNKLYELLK